MIIFKKMKKLFHRSRQSKFMWRVTIQAAISYALSGDTIMVAADDPVTGSHSDRTYFTIPQEVVLQGAGVTKSSIALDVNNAGVVGTQGAELRDICVDLSLSFSLNNAVLWGYDGVIENVLIKVDDHDKFLAGLAIDATKNISVKNVTIIGGEWAGFSAYSGTTAEIRDCIIHGAAEGIEVYSGYDHLNADYILLSDYDTPYDNQTPGPHDFIGNAALNTCGVPGFNSDALGMAADGSDVGAVQFDWDAETADFQLALTGGDAQRGDDEEGNRMWFAPGDNFSLDWSLNHEVCGGVNLDVYLLLDVYGTIYFWPSWTTDLDFKNITVMPETYTENALSFVWPDCGEFSSIPVRVGTIPGQLTDATDFVTPLRIAEIGGLK
ncbi:right-handed parallel beta-helix repeat-containing protein [bacterium]|nr:right-handed parallel beta-helix repeat-containing protein [bacterium]